MADGLAPCGAPAFNGKWGPVTPHPNPHTCTHTHIHIHTHTHNRIEVDTGYRIREEKTQQNNQRLDGTMRSLNFHEEEKIDWESISRQVEELP